MELLNWIESTSFSIAVREADSLWGYGGVLILHGMGLGIAVGISSMIGLRVLGFAPDIPLAPMKKFFPIIWVGFWINALSGSVIMMSHATQMFTNWIMYIKLASIIVAVTIIRWLQTQVFRNPGSGQSVPANARILAGTLLFLWLVAITAGRLTAYFGALVNRFDTALVR